jgi:GT2 family glycosyltransferase
MAVVTALSEHDYGEGAMPSVAVVILNWNGKKYLEQFLPILLKTNYPNYKVVVADNASTDDSVDFVKQHFSAVEVIVNPSNEGFAKGYNTALQQVKADYFVLLNSDVEVTENWITPIINLMQANKNIAACQPKILAYQQRNHFEYAGASGGWIDQLGYPFSRGRIFDIVEEDRQQYDNAAPCFWASGAAMFVRAELYHDLGGLDPYFFAHQEEIDFCWRAQLQGYEIWVEPTSVVYHIGGGTLPKNNQRKVYLNFRNNLIMLAKNLPLTKALYVIPMRLALDAVAAWKGLLEGSSAYWLAIAKAHMHFFVWMLVGPRQAQKKPIATASLQGFFRGSVIWQHFIQKKTRFSEIVFRK